MTEFPDVPAPAGWTPDDIAGLELAIRAEVMRQVGALLDDPPRLRRMLDYAEKRQATARRLWRGN